MPEPRSELLLISGRSGVGKSSVMDEISHQLENARVRHVALEGDMMDWAWPPPWEHDIDLLNLRAVWANYRRFGYRRLLYCNTVAVAIADKLAGAMGDDPRITGVILEGSDATARERLAKRELGSGLERQIERSAAGRDRLADVDAPWLHRIPTDRRSVGDIAAEIVALLGWEKEPHD